MTTPPPAGWYPDPSDPSAWRYWDGTAWTDQRAPKSIQAPPRRSRSWIWITAVTLSAVLIPIIAIVTIAVSVTPPSSPTNSPWTQSPADSTPQPQDNALDPTPTTPQSPSTVPTPGIDVQTNWPPTEWDDDVFDKGLLYYEDGPVLYRYLDGRDITCPEDADYAWCWTLEVVSKTDCTGGFALEGDIYDIYERNVGLIDVVTAPAIAGQILLVPIGSLEEDAKDAYVTSVKCR